jgi:quercetin 2,3-dioxygenase
MKKLDRIIRATPHSHWVGDGFLVRPIFANLAFTEAISPFLMFDYAAPTPFAPTEQKRGVGPHPHRGFETVTLALQGEVAHRDSAGHQDVIYPGDVQWMTAAGGIIHEEMHSANFAQQGGTLEMVQLWVNLPARHKMGAPHYQALTAAQIPVVPLPHNAGTARLIAGDFNGVAGAAKTYSPVTLWDMELNANSTVQLTLPAGHTAMLFVLRGDLKIDTQALNIADLAVMSRSGSALELSCTEACRVLFLGGEPIAESIVQHGPFVMNTQTEIQRAILDYQSGAMGRM